MEDLLPYFKQHFDDLQERRHCFRNQEVHVEGWFKGEMLFLLSALQRHGIVEGFGRESGPGRAKVDLSLRTGDVIHWVELKHWLIGVQRGALLNPAFYFGDPTSVGVIKDYDKLVNINTSDPKWFLLLLTGNPGSESWLHGLSTFHRKYSPRNLTPKSSPVQFPSAYFLALVEVGNHLRQSA